MDGVSACAVLIGAMQAEQLRAARVSLLAW